MSDAAIRLARRVADLLESNGEAPPLRPEELRAIRAIEVLLRIGTPETRPLLRRLVRADTAIPVATEASAALLALTHRAGPP